MPRFLALLVCLWGFALEAASPLTITTGPDGGTYARFGEDIARAALARGLTVVPQSSGGSIQNIERVTGKGQASLGIVQSDVLGALSRSGNADTARRAARLGMIAPLFREEVHILATHEVAEVSQLNGRRVIVGEKGSGSALTAANIFALLGVAPSAMLHRKAADGIVALLDGKADALVLVGGKPMKVFENLGKLASAHGGADAALLRQLHFLPLNDPRLMSEYTPSTLDGGDYGFITSAVPTVATSAVLVAFDFSARKNAYQQRRCDEIMRLRRAVGEMMPSLKVHGHPKWKEVQLDRMLPLWPVDRCASGGAPLATPAAASSALEKDLMGVVKQRP